MHFFITTYNLIFILSLLKIPHESSYGLVGCLSGKTSVHKSDNRTAFPLCAHVYGYPSYVGMGRPCRRTGTGVFSCLFLEQKKQKENIRLMQFFPCFTWNQKMWKSQLCNNRFKLKDQYSLPTHPAATTDTTIIIYHTVKPSYFAILNICLVHCVVSTDKIMGPSISKYKAAK